MLVARAIVFGFIVAVAVMARGHDGRGAMMVRSHDG